MTNDPDNTPIPTAAEIAERGGAPHPAAEVCEGEYGDPMFRKIVEHYSIEVPDKPLFPENKPLVANMGRPGQIIRQRDGSEYEVQPNGSWRRIND